MKEMTPVTIKYFTSFGKWVGIRRFAELNGLDVSKIDAMIARIKKVGDVEMDETFTFTIRGIDSFFHSIYNDIDNRPCPHCCMYDWCFECPLNDGDDACCKEWRAVKRQLENYERYGICNRNVYMH